MKTTKTGILLINLGTPDQARPWPVALYLREFLMDPYVIDVPWIWRALLIYLVIMPIRSFKSAHAYQSIWRGSVRDPKGSPLKYFHLSLTQHVAQQLAPVPVRAAMRYGRPGLAQAMAELKQEGVTHVLAFPLYPQYALASSVSSLEAVRRLGQKLDLNVDGIEDFYSHPEFIAAEEAVAREVLGHGGGVREAPEVGLSAGEEAAASVGQGGALSGGQDLGFDYYLFSFHGVPERHITRVAGPACFSQSDCCEQVQAAQRKCYRAQCVQTAKRIAERLGLSSEQYSVSFQSRLGRTPWIQPFTDFELTRLAQAGVKRLAVFSPSFVADCLETLEEIEMRGRAQFREAGGEELVLIPSLNDHPRWVQAVSAMVRERLGSMG